MLRRIIRNDVANQHIRIDADHGVSSADRRNRSTAESDAASLIIRAQWLLGRAKTSFASKMWNRAMRREPTRVVVDQSGRPTLASDLANGTWRLLEASATGVFHLANSGEATWYDVAEEIFARLGVPELLAPCHSGDFPRSAKRPAYSVLDTSKAEQLLGTRCRPWRGALGSLLDSMSDSGALPRS